MTEHNPNAAVTASGANHSTRKLKSEKIPSWEALAHRLADRLQYHDFCDNGHQTIAEGLAEGCPNCDDREVLRLYRLKAPPRNRKPIGVAVPIHEIRENRHG